MAGAAKDLRKQLAEAFSRAATAKGVTLGRLRYRLADAALGVFGDDAQEKLLADMMERTRIRDLQFRGGVDMDIDSARELTSAWVAAARAMLGEAPNYSETPVEFEVKVAESPERYVYVLTVQRAERPTPHQLRQRAEAEVERWRGAFEALHARLLRDLPGDGSELAPPDDAFWAAQLDGLATYADELYRETEPGTVPAAADKQRS